MRSKWITAGLILAILAGVAVLLVMVRPVLLGLGANRRIATTPVILKQVQGLSELVSVKYVMEKVVLLEDVKWYGENRILLVAHGIVKAGINLEQLQADQIQISSNKVVIALPAPMITDVYLDEQKTRVIEHSTGLLRSFDKNLQQSARLEALDTLRRSARHGGILVEAEARAKSQLKLLFKVLGYEEVEFTGRK